MSICDVAKKNVATTFFDVAQLYFATVTIKIEIYDFKNSRAQNTFKTK